MSTVICNPGVDYVILKINEKNISDFSQTEATDLLLKSDDTILLEICRRQPDYCRTFSDLYITGRSNDSTDVAPHKGTFMTAHISLAFCRENSDCDSKSNIYKIHKETQTYAGDHLEVGIEPDTCSQPADNENNQTEGCPNCDRDIDIEEVLLQNLTEPEGIGVTLCYINNSNTFCRCARSSGFCKCRETISTFPNYDKNDSLVVFINEIIPNGAAERNGRLQSGDQILQINGKNVRTREDVKVLNTSIQSDIKLLVSRCIDPDDDDDDENDYFSDKNMAYENSFIDTQFVIGNDGSELDRVFLTPDNRECPHSEVKFSPFLHFDLDQRSVSSNASKFETEEILESGLLNTHLKKDLSNTGAHMDKLRVSDNYGTSMGVAKTNGNKYPNSQSNHYLYQESEHIYETIPENSDGEPSYCLPCELPEYISNMEALDQNRRISKWLSLRPQNIPTQPESIKCKGKVDIPAPYPFSTCKQLNRSYTAGSSASNQTSGSSSSAGYPEKDIGGSATLMISKDIHSYFNNSNASFKESKIEDNPQNGTQNDIRNPLRYCHDMLPKKVCRFSEQAHIKFKGGSNPDKKFSAPNLSQYHFVSCKEVMKINKRDTDAETQKPNGSGNEETSMVWKVKRRPDGSRYIVRRPARRHSLVDIQKTLDSQTIADERAISKERIKQVARMRHQRKPFILQ